MFEIVDHDDVSRARHDLRTVVNHLQGYVVLLQEEEEPWNREPEVVQALELIYESSQEVLRIIELAAPGKRRISPASLLTQLGVDLEAPMRGVESALLALSGVTDAVEHPDVKRLRSAGDRLHSFVTKGFVVAEKKIKDARSKPAASSTVAKILVIEDDEGNRDLLERMLSRYSYQVTGAATGTEALRYIAREGFDLILLDLLLPDIDGFSLLRRMRNDVPLTPVIVVSALNDMDNVIRCIEEGAEDYFAKPFIPILLRTRVASALDRKHYRALLAQLSPIAP